MTPTPTPGPGSDQQALAIHYEHFLVAMARAQRVPNEAHKALVGRWSHWLKQAGGVARLGKPEQQLAQSIATERVADDDLVGRCLCGYCPAKAVA